MNPIIQPNSTVLFQGDSITDAGRDRNNPDGLGNGYANMAASFFSARYPALKVKFLNRGISGNRVIDLQSRWQEDCIDLKPDWVSILIGINDCWRRYDRNDPTSAEDFKSSYHAILSRVRDELGARIIICEPFVLPVPEDRRAWRVDLDPKITAARELAVEFNALYVPFDGIFAAASTQANAAFWAGDGVHPSQAGHALMAEAWLKTVGA